MLVILSALLFSLQFHPCFAFLPEPLCNYCDNKHGNYTCNSTYHHNLHTLLSTISSNTKFTSRFYNLSYGNAPDIVNGLAYCRGDVSLDDCRSCLEKATNNLVTTCTNQKQAIKWYDNCMVRYTDRTLFGVMELCPSYAKRNKSRALDESDFNRVLLDLFEGLRSQTAAGNSTLKFAMHKANVSSTQTVYAYAQCTPDLSQSDCYNCLSNATSELPDCCLPYQGLTFFRPSCNIRYEVYKFSCAFDSLAVANSSETPSSPPPTLLLRPPSTPSKGNGSTIAKTTVVVVVSMTVAFLSLGVIIYLCFRQDRRERKAEISSNETLQISYADIKYATHEFAEANKLGRGEFGIVYKGMLVSGEEIAVKRLASNSVQGEAEFRTEVLLVAKLQHRNLVKLLGYSLEGEERLLIYEFVQNTSLDHFLFGKMKHVYLDWNTRYNIIGGIARGLLYLHEDSRVRIVHRDLKASNILLDDHLNPKIADFGMARLFHADQTHADTEQIAGTLGYMAPEYVYCGIFSVKSDVYSFGVLVLEIISGQKNSGILESDSMEDLLTSVWRNWREGTTFEVVDSALVSASRTQIIRCIQIGLLCVQEDPINRPTMSLVNLMLNSDSQSMPVPTEPAYVLQRSMAIDLQALNSREDESIAELYP